MKNRLSLSLAALGLLALGSTANAELIYGITDPSFVAAPSLVSFDSATPGTLTTLGPLSGVVAGQAIRGIDFRPADGMLYAVSSGTTAATAANAQLYTVNLATGALTTVGGGFAITGNGSTRVSLDFNPVVDRLRVVTGTGQNLRVNPNNGALAGTDTNINPGTPLISGVAYTNNVVGATQTTLYAYDFITDDISTIGGINGAPSPNTGTLNLVGSSGVTSFSGALGFDISGATGIAYLNMDDFSSPTDDSEFFTVDLGTGALTAVGDFPAPLLDLSVFLSAPVAVPEPGTVALMMGLGVAGVALRRRKK